MAIESIRQMTVEEYFAFDEASEYKNEYIDGEVIPMTGGTLYRSWSNLKGIMNAAFRTHAQPFGRTPKHCLWRTGLDGD